MVEGKIVQCIGAVVDVEFPREGIPKVYDALKMDNSDLTLEVQQQLGDGIVRTIALGSSDGVEKRNGNKKYRCSDNRPRWASNSWTNYGCFRKSN